MNQPPAEGLPSTFARWQIDGDFDGRPLTRENDAMVVTAWKE
jgi:hypothetical protein